MADMAKSICAVDGCDRGSESLGFCSMHYQRQLHGKLGVCSVEECGQDARYKSLCTMHYHRERSQTTPLCSVVDCNNKAVSLTRGLCQKHEAWRKGALCSVAGCGKLTKISGFCSMHYYRVWKYGEPGEAEPRRRPARTCKVDACVNPACGVDDLCKGHHDRMKTFGNTDGRLCECGAKAVRNLTRCRDHHIAEMRRQIGNLEQPPTNRGGERKVNGGGYITYNVLGIAIHEHRAVMERSLSRSLEPFENVHHKNGVRTDNRPENLELWVTMQPSGQRPEDLVQWVVDHYPALVREQLEKESHG